MDGFDDKDADNVRDENEFDTKKGTLLVSFIDVDVDVNVDVDEDVNFEADVDGRVGVQ